MKYGTPRFFVQFELMALPENEVRDVSAGGTDSGGG
jgi:hypothetical protein